MGVSYTTERLIDDILLLGHVPIADQTFSEDDLLRLATLEIQTPVMRQILSIRGGYYKTYLDFDIASDGIYVIPAGAIMAGIENVELVVDPSIIPVNIIEEQEQFSTIAPTSTSYGGFFRGNSFQILPIPNIGVARFWFNKRTSDLIQTSDSAQVTAVNGSVITVDTVPTTIVDGDYVDACGDQPPFNLLAEDILVTDITGTDITLASSVPDLAIGDWLAPHGFTPIPQIPVEFRLITAQKVVCKIYEIQGYFEKLERAEAKLKKYEEDTFSLLTPRVKTQTRIINPVNGGALSGNRNRYTNFAAGR